MHKLFADIRTRLCALRADSAAILAKIKRTGTASKEASGPAKVNSEQELRTTCNTAGQTMAEWH